MTLSHAGIIVLTSLASAGGVPTRASQASAARSVPLVTIDFRALTPDGQPVLDLKPADVTLKIDGRAREIRSLDLLQTGDRAPSALPAPYASNSSSDGGRDIMLLIDDESIVPGKEAPAKEAVDKLITSLSGRDRVGLLTLTQGGVNISPTNQHATIRSAASSIVGRLRSGETDGDFCIRTRVALQTVTALFSNTSGTIVFFSTGLMAASGESQAQMGASSSSGLCQIFSSNYREVANAANVSRATLYVVQATDGTELPRPVSTSRRSSGNASNNDPIAGLDSLAGITGAETIRLVGNTDAIARVARETSASYVVAFEPDASERNGSNHKIELRVGRDGVKVRARPEVTILKADAKPAAAATPRDMLRVAQAYRDLPLRAAAYASRNPGDEQVKIVVVFESADPTANWRRRWSACTTRRRSSSRNGPRRRPISHGSR